MTPARIRSLLLPALALLSTSHAVFAQRPVEILPQPSGFLCCNMHTDGKWISDINYIENAPTVVPLGTPARVTGYGNHRVMLQLGDRPQALGNDYSRTMKLVDYARRYVVPHDPRTLLATYPPQVRDAISAGHIRAGMTREQVVMAVGYPITSENPTLDAPTWRYWRSMTDEFQVLWADGVVKEVVGDTITKRAVFED